MEFVCKVQRCVSGVQWTVDTALVSSCWSFWSVTPAWSRGGGGSLYMLCQGVTVQFL